MKAIICDRCGKVEKANQGACSLVPGFSIQCTTIEPYDIKQYELCSECAKVFETWIKGNKNESW